jgi:hypothetical protein
MLVARCWIEKDSNLLNIQYPRLLRLKAKPMAGRQNPASGIFFEKASQFLPVRFATKFTIKNLKTNHAQIP